VDKTSLDWMGNTAEEMYKESSRITKDMQTAFVH